MVSAYCLPAGFNARLEFGELALRRPVEQRFQKQNLCSDFLSLTLLVLGVLADNANDATAMNYLALVTDLLD
jgi:hypothetical protein